MTWIAKRRTELALALEFGPMTARGYAALVRVIVTERLWRVGPARGKIRPRAQWGSGARRSFHEEMGELREQ
jgi:hypothetical protein